MLVVMLEGLGDELELPEDGIERRDVRLVHDREHELEEETLEDVVVRVDEEPGNEVVPRCERQQIETLGGRKDDHFGEDLDKNKAVESEGLRYLIGREGDARNWSNGGGRLDEII